MLKNYLPFLKCGLIHLFTAATFFILSPAQACAYIMPPAQVLEYAAKNFSEIKTLVITRSVEREDTKTLEIKNLLKEEIRLKSPGFFRAEIIERFQDTETRPSAEMISHKLLLSQKSHDLMLFLYGLGIDTGKISLDRTQGVVCYRIGGTGPENPVLFVEKRRFLPLLLRYRSPSETLGWITVRYEEFRRLDKAWYPYLTIYSTTEAFTEKARVLDLQANLPVGSPLYEIDLKEYAPPRDISPEIEEGTERHFLDKIKLLEEKYQ